MNNESRLKGILKTLGPGLLMAGAAIGVSHLVQSTRAGASYGYALIWAVLLANLFKYPFLEFGPRYATMTGNSLLEGYMNLGKWAMGIFIIFTLGTMFTIQAAVTVVTAGLASQLTGIALGPVTWSAIILVICIALLMSGQYPMLDTTMKIIMALLVVSTITALIAAIFHGQVGQVPTNSPVIWNITGVSFLLALMGWMPIPIDVSVWHSLWTLEREKQTSHKPSMSESLFDFNLGYLAAAFMALAFLLLGALLMYGTGEKFADSGAAFAGQLIQLYTDSLGNWSYPIIGLAAFTTMFSTTLTVTDAYPRVLRRALRVMYPEAIGTQQNYRFYLFFIILVPALSLGVLALLGKSFTFMVDLATILSFLTAPLLGYINYRVVTSEEMPEEGRPPFWLKILSWGGLIFLSGFALLYLYWLVQY